METGATSKDWATKLLRGIYEGGCCGTINLTDFVSSTGMTPISASNINITINGINLSNICIQKASMLLSAKGKVISQ